MPEFKTTLNGKPAIVEIVDKGCVQVSSGGQVWGFTSDLKPAFLQFPLTGDKMRFRFDGNQIFSTVTIGDENKPEHATNVKDDLTLGTFRYALGAIQAVSAPDFPAEVKLRSRVVSEMFGVNGKAK